LLWYIAALSAPCILFIAYFVILRYQADNLIAEIAKEEKTPAAVPASKPLWSTSLVEELRKTGVRAVEEPQGVRITLETLLFTAGSAQLNVQARPQIDDIVATVKRYAPGNSILIEGHASRERAAY